MSDIKVLTLVGSLRAASVNRQIAALAAETAPAGITVNLYQGLAGGLGELPLYNEDIDNAADLPATARALRGAVARRRDPGGDTGVQRRHSRRTQERDRLAVSPLREQCADGQAAGCCWRLHGPVWRGMGPR